MIIYVVTSGEYSDYRIDAVFSSEQKGKDFIVKKGEGEIEEWELDESEPYEKGPVYGAVAKMTDGSAHVYKISDRLRHPAQIRKGHSADMVYVESPVSKEHALKCAIEYRQAILRETPK